MKHAKGFTAYARETGHKPHSPNDYTVETIDGQACCGLCTFPVVGAAILYRITSDARNINRLINEFHLWRIRSTAYRVDGCRIYTSDSNVVDVATESFINAPETLTIETLWTEMN